MKIPVILAQAEIPSSVPAAAPSSAGAPFAALARVGESLARTGTSLIEIEAVKQREFAKAEAAQVLADVELETRLRTQELQDVERDPDQYVARHSTLLDESLKRARERATTPLAQQIIQQRLPGLLTTQRVNARKHASDLYRQRDAGLLTSTLDTHARLAGLTAISDPKDFAQQLLRGLERIDSSMSLNEKEKAAERITFRDRLVEERATRHLQLDAADFLTRQDTYAAWGLAPEKRNALTEQAEQRLDQQRKDANAAEEKYQRYLDQEEKRVEDAMMLDLERAASEGRGSLDELNFLIEQRWITRENADRIRTMIAKGAEEGPSRNQALLTDYLIDASSITPRLTEATVRAAQARGDLSTKDTVKLLDKLGSATRAQEADQRAAHTQAEQVGRARLGLSAPFDQWDAQDKALWAIFLEELTARSQAWGGQEPPLTISADIAERLAPMRQQRLRLKGIELRKSLMFPAPSAQEAKQRLDGLRSTLPSQVYDQQKRLILDLLRAENEEAVAAGGGPRTETFGPGGAAQPQRAPLRRPGQTPKSE